MYGIFVWGFVIDMVLVKGEEFFYFIEFWVIELSEGKLIIVYVCFESFFVVGVYKFVI